MTDEKKKQSPRLVLIFLLTALCTCTVITVVLVITLIAGETFFYTVGEKDFALLTRLGKLEKITDEEGTYSKKPDQKMITFSKGLFHYKSKKIMMITADKIPIELQASALWHIIDPNLFYKSFGSIYQADDYLNTVITIELSKQVSANTFTQLIRSSNRIKKVDKEILEKYNYLSPDLANNLASMPIIEKGRNDLEIDIKKSCNEKLQAAGCIKLNAFYIVKTAHTKENFKKVIQHMNIRWKMIAADIRADIKE